MASVFFSLLSSFSCFLSISFLLLSIINLRKPLCIFPPMRLFFFVMSDIAGPVESSGARSAGPFFFFFSPYFPLTRSLHCPSTGKRRYDRKQSGFGGQTKPVFHKKVRLQAEARSRRTTSAATRT